VNAPVTRELLLLARRTVRVVVARGAVREVDMPGLIGCAGEDARAAVGIARGWRKVDYCAGFIAAAASRDEGKPAA
jgi:hypothetical protein